MKIIRYNLLLKYLWGLLAFLIFNYSIDAPDLYGDSIPEDITYNDIESITELVLEIFIGIENAVPEHDEDDSEGGSNFAKKIDMPVSQRLFMQENPFISVVQTEQDSYIKSFFENPYLSGQIKPPQV